MLKVQRAPEPAVARAAEALAMFVEPRYSLQTVAIGLLAVLFVAYLAVMILLDPIRQNLYLSSHPLLFFIML